MEGTKIIAVSIEKLNIPLDAPFTIATGAKYQIENVLITLTLENGIMGYGEAAPLEPVNGENQGTALATLLSCKDYLKGKSVSDYRQISKHLKSVFWAQVTARCTIEMALLDAYTKCLNIPLYQFLGGAERLIETDYTIDIVSAATAKTNAQKLAAKGYKTLKTKVGKKLQDDVARVIAIKEGAPDCKIMLDANQGYSPADAIHFLELLEKNGVRPELFEQPVVKHDLRGMKRVKDSTSVPIAADESVFTAADALAVAKADCADLINIKIMKSGIVEALDIAAIARTANMGLMIGCMLESKLGLGTSVHFAAGLGGFSFIDLDPHIDPAKEPFSGGPDFSDPCYRMNELPGIGLTKNIS
ncbi:dipeptide epimerase [Mangrovibacterium lignilyticum]|uniref:dipeptide epimerase n=1 Tax=Mangrovibacterium lignilyticum TaxID=2668052 RepID=UPI0013D20E5B|nr:dipeptide epimerase [Mangrovibacterium lignilyticum]